MEHALGTLDPVLQAVLKTWVSTSALDVVFDGGSDHFRDRATLYRRHCFQCLGLLR